MRLHPRTTPLALALALAFCAPAPHALRAQVLPSGFTDSIVTQNLDLPVAFDFLPDHRIVVAEQYSGRIRLIVNGQVSTSDPVLTVPGFTVGSERGLLGVAVDPQFPARPYLYTHQTSLGSVIRISRWTLTGDLNGTSGGALSASPASRFDLLLNIPDAAGNHNGGTVRFGPDGMLYVTIGDDADYCAAQNIGELKGKVLRLRTNTLPPGPGTANYAQITPPDNPYVARPDSAGRLVYAYGLRNPFRAQVDPVRNCLVIGDVGLGEWEEMDLLALPGGAGPDIAPAGANFGWPWREGPTYYVSCGGAEPVSAAPIYALDRTGMSGASIISAGAYRMQLGGSNFPNEYEGDIFFSEYYSGNVYRLEWNGSSWAIAAPEPGQPSPGLWATGFASVADWRMGHDGALWACRQYINGFRNAGRIERIAYTGNTSVPPGTSAANLRVSSYPSPARGQVTLALQADGGETVSLRVYDVRGRLVRDLGHGITVAPSNRLVWDGLDEEGREAPNGVYWARVESGTREARCAIVMAR